MATMLKSLVKKTHKPRKTVNIKLWDEEVADFKARAKRYTKGNVTCLIREAVRRFKPTKNELVEVHT